MKDLMNDVFSQVGAEVSVIPVMQGEGMMKIEGKPAQHTP